MGNGISCSTLAHNLHLSHGIDIHLCKSSDRLGGDVRSATVCDEDRIFLYKEGPISFEALPSVVRISHELNLEDNMVFAPYLSPWIHHTGGLHPLHGGNFFGPGGGVLKLVLFDDLLSWQGKLRAFMGAFLDTPPPSPPWRVAPIIELLSYADVTCMITMGWH